MEFSPAYILSVGQIVWIDLLLSGDNAVVIALACRSLPEKQRRIGILLGAGAAIGLRIIFAFIITQILGIPFLKALGGILLIWIAIKLIWGEESGGKRDRRFRQALEGGGHHSHGRRGHEPGQCRGHRGNRA